MATYKYMEILSDPFEMDKFYSNDSVYNIKWVNYGYPDWRAIKKIAKIRLTPKQYEVLSLLISRGWTQVMVGSYFGVSQQAISERYRRATNKLKIVMGEYLLNRTRKNTIFSR